MIKLEDVGKVYDVGSEKFSALSHINLSIKDGEFVGILGSSGSGKSTLMHILGLLDKPSYGKVIVDGKDTSKLSDNKISQLRNEYVGFVFQQFNLINNLTVEENILLPTHYAKKKLEFDTKQRADELLEELGLTERAKFFPNKISGGQQQRAAIARALVMKPGLVLADEPTGNLDSKTGKEIMVTLASLNSKFGVTVIVVTHDQNVVSKTKRRIFIKDGKIVQKYL
ncbi:ABC transporter ATP-binding protein [Patescibacteria group bacterium]|nr:ABC transporter ATP-binding protein [Patescibacteria group bacterium]